MIWAIVQQLGTQGINYLIFIIFALLLDPKELGLLGVAMVWISFLQVFSEVGFSAALIQRSEVGAQHLSTTFFVNVSLGIFLSFLAFALSSYVALFFKIAELKPIIQVLSIIFLINSFSLTQVAVAQRGLKFRALAIRDICATLIGGVVGLILAYFHYGIWSLVIQQLITYVISTLLFWHLSPWRPDISQFSVESLAELWHYGSKIFFFNLFKFASQNIDKILIGYLLGATALGIYTFAYKLVVFPAVNVVGAVGIYLFPKLSRIQGNSTLIQNSYLLILKAISAIILPAMILVALLVPTVVPLLFGEKWVSAIPIMQILAIVAVMQAVISPVGQLMKALNRPDWLLWWSIGFTIITAVSITIGSYWGMTGISLGLLIIHAIGIIVISQIIVKLTSINSGLVFNSLQPTTIALSLFGFLLILVSFLSAFLENNAEIINFAGVAISAIFYGIMLNWFDRTFVSTCLTYLLGDR